MGRGHVEFLRLDEVAVLPCDLFGQASGLRGACLSRDLETGAETAVLTAAPLWRWDARDAVGRATELLLLSGELHVGAEILKAGDYCAIPARAVADIWFSPTGAQFLWMSSDSAQDDGKQDGRESADATVLRISELPWRPSPSFEGREASEVGPGLSVKFLREDEATGAYTLLTRHAPGWSDPRLESHDTWEELILLEGDYLMGETGALTAGAYIFRPGTRPHGPQATRNGAVWFCRGERRIDFQFTEAPWADGHVNLYLQDSSVPGSFKPWGSWS